MKSQDHRWRSPFVRGVALRGSYRAAGRGWVAITKRSRGMSRRLGVRVRPADVASLTHDGRFRRVDRARNCGASPHPPAPRQSERIESTRRSHDSCIAQKATVSLVAPWLPRRTRSQPSVRSPGTLLLGEHCYSLDRGVATPVRPSKRWPSARTRFACLLDLSDLANTRLGGPLSPSGGERQSPGAVGH
jgi:hypothetical protein